MLKIERVLVGMAALSITAMISWLEQALKLCYFQCFPNKSETFGKSYINLKHIVIINNYYFQWRHEIVFNILWQKSYRSTLGIIHCLL